MPIPILLLVRAEELGRHPEAADFSVQERRELRRCLEECIEETDAIGDMENGDYLREVWDRCITLGEAPRFPADPRLVEQRSMIEAGLGLAELGAKSVVFFPETGANDE